MIKQRTVFIIGAGASAPYGFPSGIELKNQIIKLFSNPASPKVERLHSYFRVSGYSEIIKNFREALLYSGKISVDAFLEHRPEFVDLGKLAIATVLIPCEIQDTLFSIDNQKNWYQHLYQKMNAPFETFGSNQVVFITYNYDRSLEHFLFTALRNTYGKSDTEVAAQLRQIPFVHLHGQLGYLPWQELPQGVVHPPRGYVPKEQDVSLSIAAAGIKIIHEQPHNDSAFRNALEHLSDAKKIIFLGFGYDPTNLSRLHIEDFFDAQGILYGSCYGFTELEQKTLALRFKNKISLGNSGEDALSYLRQHIELR
jgi:hypothetical protein